MAVDHGLGGKDNKKSKEKRARKKAKITKIARTAITGGKKQAVVFDEAARVEYLTGFRKRKQERRKFGLTMQVLKEKKNRRVAKAEARKYIKSSTIPEEEEDDEETHKDDNDENEEEDDQKVEETQPINQVFDDDHTKNMFGGSVSITIDTIEV